MGTSRQIERDAADWLARRDAAPWSPLDQAALDAWLSAATAHRIAFLRLESAWNESGRLQALGAGVAQGDLPERGRWSRRSFDPRKPSSDIAEDPAPALPGARTRTPPRRSFVPLQAAAALLLLILGWSWLRHENVVAESFRTSVGDLRTLRLADGSDATLSSDSEIEVALSRAERHIALRRGEAYFDVSKDPNRPFAVEVGGRRAVAVGTRFSVRRDDNDAVRVIVTEGVVRLESAPVNGVAQPETLLPAGSVALADRHGVLVRTGSIAEAESDVDWRRGFLVFRDTPLATAVAEFNRYNTRPIVIADAAAAQLRVGGSFRWSNADTFVNLIEQAMPVQAEREAQRIVLRSR
jgi:transmembrane sensor